MRSILWFVASGAGYSPSKISFAFTRKNDVGQIKERGKNAGLPYTYGSSTVEVDASLPLEEQMTAILSLVTPLAEAMKAAGADSFQLNALILEARSVFEVSPSQLAMLASLDCHFRVTYDPSEKPA
jgi:hypothetical protein